MSEIYSKTYKGFRGVDFSSSRSDCDPTRFHYLVNMWRDYHSEQGAAVETAPGFRTLFKTEGKVHGMHYLPGKSADENGRYIVHAGNKLFTVNEKNNDISYFSGMNEARSQSVLFHDRIYMVDGKTYCRISASMRESADKGGYVPTTYRDGESYEQKNMLTDRFWEIYTQPSYEEGTGNYYYSIHEILRSFSDNNIELVFTFSDGSTVENIYPFITKATESDWEYTPAVASPVVGQPVDFSSDVRIGFAVMPRDGATRYFLYDNEQKRFLGYIEEKLGYFTYYGNYGIRFTVESDSVEGANIGRIDTIFFYDGWEYKYVSETGTAWPLKFRKDIEIQLASNSEPNSFQTVGDLRNVLSGNPDFTENYKGTTKDAINGCTLICEFDGRIFLSGNPQLPNSVFYSQRDLTGYNNPFYIGCYNYLNDGTDRTPITAMMTTPTQLIVLKDDVAQGASIYYHYAQDNPSTDSMTANLQPRIYPRENGVPGVGCLGVAVNFADDPCFISPRGLEAIGKSQVNLERTLAHRSSHVDARLCNEDLRRAVACEWDGYLVLLVPGGKMYLADSRQVYTHMGDAQYEWYYFEDIGIYDGQTDRYHFVTDDYNVPEGLANAIGMPIGYKDGFADDCEIRQLKYDGGTYHYVPSDGVAYLVETDGEQTGGKMMPATALLSVDGRLLFGCEDGTVCIFNTDQRGENFYIPPEAYTYNGRRYRTGCALCSDTCGVTNMSKSTIRGSFALTTKAHPYTMVTCEVRTDSQPWSVVDEVVAGREDMSHTDFKRYDFNTMEQRISIISEHEKRWVEKQMYFYTDCYEGPFGMISATYDYKIAGKVRNR